MESLVENTKIAGENVTLEIEESLVDSPIYSYFKFRLTLDDDVWDGSDCIVAGKTLAQRRLVSMRALEEWSEYLVDMGYVAGKLTAGWEVKNKYGDFCKPHIHIHFKSHRKHDTMRKGLVNHYRKLWDERLAGNAMYSFSLCAFPESEEKFFRYPLKQKSYMIRGKHFCRGFSDETIARYAAEAHGSWVSSAECQNKKKDRIESSDTLFDRLLNFCNRSLAV